MSGDVDQLTAKAIAKSAETAAKLVISGDLTGAKRAVERAERRLAELRARLPGHARLVRQSAHCVELARRAMLSPKRQENEETGELEKVRERLGHRALRASGRAHE